MAEKEGFVCIFIHFGMKIMELPLSSQRQATCHRHVAFGCSNPSYPIKILPIRMDEEYFYGGEGGI